MISPYIFIMLRCTSPRPIVSRIYITQPYCVLSKSFSNSIEMIMWCFDSKPSIWCITFIDWHMLNHSWTFGVKQTWLWWMTYFPNACNQLEDIFMRIFTSMSIRDIGLQVLLLCFYLVFGIGIIPNMGFMEEVLKWYFHLFFCFE